MFNLSKAKYSKIIINVINISFIILSIYIAYDYQIELFSVFNLHPLFKYITTVSYYFLIFEGFYYLTKISKDNPKNSVIYFIIVIAIAEGFTSSVATTNYINERTMIILLPITIVLLLSFINVTYFTKLSVYIISILLILLCFVQKLREPYNWWGYIDEPLNEKTVPMNVEGLKGFKLSPYEAKTYNEVIKVINSNSNKNTTILSYPYVQILSVLTKHTDINRFVPVYFYDVCPDEMAIEDAKILKENPPDIIIYMTIPGCMEIHEQLFRDGKESGQRKIVEFIKESTENNYTLIGQIANLYVFKDLKGKKPNYTYIENNDISQIFDDIK
jgi:hypothetical protein